MRSSFRTSGPAHWLPETVLFLKKHIAVITGLGLIAAFGRVIQLGGFGPITPSLHWVLELFIEASRIGIFLYVLGLASVPNGFLRVRQFFTRKAERKRLLEAAGQKLKRQWFGVVLNLIGFSVIAWAINCGIDHLAYKTCFYLTLRREGLLAPDSSEWTLLLFFKNLSVIPFTLVFEALFLLWLTDKLHVPAKPEGI